MTEYDELMKKGLPIEKVKKLMLQKCSWWKFLKEETFETGEINLHYTSGNDKLCYFFDSNKRLAKTIFYN